MVMWSEATVDEVSIEVVSRSAIGYILIILSVLINCQSCCNCTLATSVQETVCNNSKNVKSHVFNVEKRTYSFTGHLILCV